MEQKELIILGYGNMARAIISSLLLKKKSDLSISKITVTGRNPKKIESFLNEFFKEKKSEFKDTIFLESSFKDSQADSQIECNNKILLLACKPQNLGAFRFTRRAFITYSVLAGVSSDVLRQHIESNHYVMLMPNICATYALSSTAVLWDPQDSKAQLDSQNLAQDPHQDSQNLTDIKKHIESFVSSFGSCIFVDNQKELISTIATSGSSPALLALVAQSLINAGVHQGLRVETSAELVQKTFEGIARMLKDKTPQEIKDSITSSGGTTARALLHCDKHAIQGHITQACIKAVKWASGK